MSGPPGSDAIEKEFEDFYTRNGAKFVPSEFDGRSDYEAFILNGIPAGGLFTGAEGIMTEEEAEMFGGQAGVAYDVNYHAAGDDINKLSNEAFLLNTKSIANSVAKYAMSFDSLEPVDLAKRSAAAARARVTRRSKVHTHKHNSPCGGSRLTV